MSGNIGCGFFQEHLDAFIDSDLDRNTRAKMIRHADACPDCGEKLDRATRLAMMLAELDEGLRVPPDCQAAWRNAVRAETEKIVRLPRKRPVLRKTFVGVAAALALWFGATAALRIPGALPVPTTAGVGGTRAAFGWFADDAGEQQKMLVTATARPLGEERVYVQSDGAVTGDATATQAPQDSVPTAMNAGDIVVLKSATRALETEQFDQSMQLISELTSDYDGYLEQSSVQGQPRSDIWPDGRTASIVARVPVTHLEAFLQSLDTVATVVEKSETSQDVSDAYYDVESRKDAYQTQLARLNDMVGEAGTLEDMLLVQDKIAQVQSQLDALEGELRGWASKANYASVRVTMREVAPSAAADTQAVPEDLSERVHSAFTHSVTWLKAFLQDAAVVGAWMAPILVILLPIVIVLCVIVGAVRRRKRRKRS